MKSCAATETLEAQLWNLTGAVGGLGLGGTVAPGPGVDGMTRKGNRGYTESLGDA